jgi:outer membrane protein assembly factor BamB
MWEQTMMEMIALDARTGTVKWKYQHIGNISSSPKISMALFILVVQRCLVCCYSSNGQLSGKYQTGAMINHQSQSCQWEFYTLEAG